MSIRNSLLLLLIMILAACGTPTFTPTLTLLPADTPNPPTATLAPTPTEKVWTYKDMVVGFIQPGSESGWRAANTASFKQIAEELGITLKFSDAMFPVSEKAFTSFLADEEVNVIVLDAIESTGWEDLLREARDAGKIVILEDRRIDAPEDLYATLVSNDFAEEGRKAGRAMVELLEGSDKKNIVEIAGIVGAGAAIDRAEGFRQAIEGSGIEITQSQVGNFIKYDGKAAMAAILKESTDIQGVFAQNDDMGLGAIEAIKEAGLRPGVDIKIVSIDATAGAFEAMLAGELNVSVECSPLLAPQVYEAALRALNGEDLPKFIAVNETVFYADMPNLAEIAEGRKY